MVKAVVAGAAGGIGQPLSLLLKMSPSIDELALYDVVNSPGVAADLSHISTPIKVTGHLPENDGLAKAVTGADLVLIPAGVPRKPGMTRDDLFKINAGIVAGLAEAVAKHAPKAFVLVISNPVNSTVPVVVEILKKHNVFDPRRVFGVTTLDTVRAKTFIGEITHTNPRDVTVPVIGGHSGTTIVPILSQSNPSVAGIDANTKKELIHRVQFGGDEVVKAKAGTGSATLSMAYAGFRFAEFVLAGFEGNFSETVAYVHLSGLPGGDAISQEIGLEYFTLPVRLGPEGIVSITNILNDVVNADEVNMVKDAIKGIRENVKKALELYAPIHTK